MRLIEKLSTILVCFMAISVMYALWRAHFGAPATHPARPETEMALVGKSAKLGLGETTARTVVLIGLSSKCGFCRQDIGLYQRLIALDSSDVRVVLVFPETDSEAANFAVAHNLPEEAITTARFEDLGITATPTILLTDKHGRVKSAWVGVLDETREASLLAQLSR